MPDLREIVLGHAGRARRFSGGAVFQDVDLQAQSHRVEGEAVVVDSASPYAVVRPQPQNRLGLWGAPT